VNGQNGEREWGSINRTEFWLAGIDVIYVIFACCSALTADRFCVKCTVVLALALDSEMLVIKTTLPSYIDQNPPWVSTFNGNSM
jgi:hypothetical protein